MTKQELIAEVHARAAEEGIELSKKATGDVVDAIFDVISAELARDGRQSIAGFGTFKRKHRTARKGQNPRTGEPITIPASYYVSFKPAPALKESVNG